MNFFSLFFLFEIAIAFKIKLAEFERDWNALTSFSRRGVGWVVDCNEKTATMLSQRAQPLLQRVGAQAGAETKSSVL